MPLKYQKLTPATIIPITAKIRTYLFERLSFSSKRKSSKGYPQFGQDLALLDTSSFPHSGHVIRAILVVLVCCFLNQYGAHAQEIQSWSAAKKAAQERWISAGADTTLYCGCRWEPNTRTGGGKIGPNCAITEWSDARRLTWVEWEHIVPASWLASHMQCWQDPKSIPACNGLSGRQCCEQHDPIAQRRLFDIDNLAPTVGAANAARSNEPYGIIAGENRPFGRCDFESNRSVTEPRAEIRNWLADRTILILNRYPDTWRPEGYEDLMRAWSNEQ